MIRQLYYTSLPDGPGGRSGFQFCARSDGIDDSVLPLVERLISYEPPDEISADALPSQFPVNFLYAGLESSGQKLLARVEFTGAGFPPDNYFAHSLILDDAAADLAGWLPADMWNWPAWQSAPGPPGGLPLLELAARPSQPAGPDLPPAGGGIQRLARLTAAADAAAAGGPPVLLIGQTSETVWEWISAVSGLLGPVLGPRLSFCTHSHDPLRAGTHLVGLVSAGPVSDAGRAGFSVFDLRSGEGAAPDEPAGADGSAAMACAVMLAGAGRWPAQQAWALATRIARPAPASLASWYPALACALMSMNYPLGDAALTAAAEWLGSRQADPRSLEDILTGALGQRLVALPAAGQSALVDSALWLEAELGPERAGLASRLEEAVVSQSLEALLAGRPSPDTARLRTRSALARAEAASQRLLPRLAVQQATGLLRWAARAGVTVEDSLARQAGRDAVALALADGASIDDLPAASAQWPALRAGMVDELAILPPALLARATELLGEEVLEPGDFVAAPQCGEQWISRRAQLSGKSPVAELIEICQLRRAAGQPHLPDDELLARLWPDVGWSLAEALAVTEAFPAGELSRSPAAGMLVETLGQGPGADESQHWHWVSLASHLATWPPDQTLLQPEDARAVSLIGEGIQRLISGQADADKTIARLASYFADAPPLARAYLALELPQLILLQHSRPARVLASCPQPIMDAVCHFGYELLLDRPGDTELVAKIYVCRHDLLAYQQNRKAAQVSDTLLVPVAEYWSRKEVSAIVRSAEAIDRKAGRDFSRWITEHRARARG